MNEAREFRELLRALAPGYENSRPVRIGNAAVGQRQLDVYGEVIDTLHPAHEAGLAESETALGPPTRTRGVAREPLGLSG